MLGPATLAQLHKRIGDAVVVYLGSVIRGTKLKIVGTAALPTIGDTLGVHASLGTGALLATTVVPSSVFTTEYGPENGPNAIFVRLRPGTSQLAGRWSLQKIADEYNQLAHSPRILAQSGPSALQIQASVLPTQRPAEIVNYRTMGTLPAILSGGLAAGAVAALGLTLATSVRLRRRDFALLKTLGFTRRQLAAAIAWQSTIIIAIGLIAGVPAWESRPAAGSGCCSPVSCRRCPTRLSRPPRSRWRPWPRWSWPTLSRPCPAGQPPAPARRWC